MLYIIGSGLFGSTIAHKAAKEAGIPVTLIERRGHIGGNCYSRYDTATGIEYHVYGSHIFHTSNRRVWEFMKRFTEFNGYRHRVWTSYQGRVYPMPISLATINTFYGKALSPAEAREFIRAECEREGTGQAANLEEKAVSLIGRPLYDAFIRGYTSKQWEKDPRELSADIITRLPIRYTYDTRYFADTWEGIPLNGYRALFERMLDHPLISVRLETEYSDVAADIGRNDLLVYTGAIDEFFGYQLGRLEWRTVDLVPERHAVEDYQGTAVMNYADVDVPYTRIHEFKHYHPERPETGSTFTMKEYSRFAGEGDEPYYPVETERNRRLLTEYQALARHEAPNVIFGGRLGQYRYLDMDGTVAQALSCYDQQVTPRLLSHARATSSLRTGGASAHAARRDTGSSQKDEI